MWLEKSRKDGGGGLLVANLKGVGEGVCLVAEEKKEK